MFFLSLLLVQWFLAVKSSDLRIDTWLDCELLPVLQMVSAVKNILVTCSFARSRHSSAHCRALCTLSGKLTKTRAGRQMATSMCNILGKQMLVAHWQSAWTTSLNSDSQMLVIPLTIYKFTHHPPSLANSSIYSFPFDTTWKNWKRFWPISSAMSKAGGIRVVIATEIQYSPLLLSHLTSQRVPILSKLMHFSRKGKAIKALVGQMGEGVNQIANWKLEC